MAFVRLDAGEITDWNSFHSQSKRLFGFPEGYGNNMNAWIDCLTYLDEGDGMSRFHLAQGETLDIEVENSMSFKSRLPEIFETLLECTQFVNQRYIDNGKAPVICLLLK